MSPADGTTATPVRTAPARTTRVRDAHVGTARTALATAGPRRGERDR
ncbi:hypothetical protein ACIBCB_17505 [Streptomyces uncialis]